MIYYVYITIYIIYKCLYISYILIDHFEEGAILKASGWVWMGANHPQLCFGGKGVLIKKVFHLELNENIRKPRKY